MNITAGEMLHRLERDLSRVLVEPGNQDRLQDAREQILQQLASLDSTQRQTLLARASRRMPEVQSGSRLVSAPAQESAAAVDTEAAKSASAKAASLERQLREAEKSRSETDFGSGNLPAKARRTGK
jgi:multidrug efflux pump subunit AcrA (membrane-fusion protein)